MRRTARPTSTHSPQPCPGPASRRTPVGVTVLLGLGLHAGSGLLPGSAAHAQSAGPAASAAARTFDIPAGPLGASLAAFARQSGLLLSFDPALTQGLTAPALGGSHAPLAALDRLLAGSGLEAVPTPSGGYLLRRRAEARAPTAEAATGATLAEVTVRDSALRDGITEGSGSFTTRSTSAATGMNLSLRETPQSVTVITRERMDEQGLKSLDTALSEVPGIYVSTTGTQVGGHLGIFARGYEITSYQVDDLTAGLGGYDVHSFDTAVYDSITAVRGATGLLTGSGNPGARVVLTRKRPTRDFQASLSQSLGRWSQRRTVGDVSGPLNQAGTLRGRFVAAYDEGQSWVDRYRANKSVAYGVLEADLTSKTLVSLALQHGRTSGRAAGWGNGFDLTFGDGSLVPASRSQNTLPDSSRYSTEHTMLTARIEHQFNDNWRGQLSYGHSLTDWFGRRGDLQVGANADASMTMDRIDWRTVKPYRVRDLAGKLEGQYELFGRRNDLVAGFRVMDSFDRSDGGGWTAPTVPFSQWRGDLPLIDPAGPGVSNMYMSDYSVRTEQAGLYAATRLRPADKLSVILGGRWSYWKTRTEEYPNSSSYDPGNPVSDDRRQRGVFTPYAGVVYDLSGNLSAYASYTEIFNPQSAKDVTGKLLDPEQGRNFEWGLKGAWLDGRLNASVAMFEVRKDNLAVVDGSNQTPDGSQAYVAQDNTKGRGWELEVSGELARGWQAQAGYTRVVTRGSDGARLSTFIPIHMFKLFTSYRVPGVPGLTLGGGVVWQSKWFPDWKDESLWPIYTQKPYAVVNLIAAYAINRHWSLTVNLNNVFDKSYRTAYFKHVYGAPRNLYATLKYRF
ncbi:MAG: TonB-dependent siderophore receptor [Ottowia sp.]|uniref:TonB-dependent siderophore receptor n=1 Tax=Ottowia sp. TaxID=1898956 RepID=UPI0039E3D387